MDCPRCNMELINSSRKDIEFSYCPGCLGTWLDSREFDRLTSALPHESTPLQIPSVSNQKQDQTAIVYDGTRQTQPDTKADENFLSHAPEVLKAAF